MYSISTNFYPENKETMIGYIEAVTGIGFILGPLLGSFLFYIGGYRFIFFSVGTLFIFMSQFVKCIFTPNIDSKKEQNNVRNSHEELNIYNSKIVLNEIDDSYQKVELYEYQS